MEISLENLYVDIGAKRVKYICQLLHLRLSALQRPLCCREAGENGKGSPLPIVPRALSFNFSIIAIFPGIREALWRREHLRHESLTYRLKAFDFFELTFSNKLAFRLKFQLFDGIWFAHGVQEGRFVICDW